MKQVISNTGIIFFLICKKNTKYYRLVFNRDQLKIQKSTKCCYTFGALQIDSLFFLKHNNNPLDSIIQCVKFLVVHFLVFFYAIFHNVLRTTKLQCIKTSLKHNDNAHIPKTEKSFKNKNYFKILIFLFVFRVSCLHF